MNDGQNDTQNENEDQPVWAPPESQPEPRPTEPVGDEPPPASETQEVSSPS